MCEMLYEFLKTHGIPYLKVEHPPVFTCEEASRLVPKIEGAETKNLFLRDSKGKRHFLLSVPASKSVDLKNLSRVLEVDKLSFASTERLQRYLGLQPGSVSLLAVINDSVGAVEVLIDSELWKERALLCHPLINTATLSIITSQLQTFLELTKHPPKIVTIT